MRLNDHAVSNERFALTGSEWGGGRRERFGGAGGWGGGGKKRETGTSHLNLVQITAKKTKRLSRLLTPKNTGIHQCLLYYFKEEKVKYNDLKLSQTSVFYFSYRVLMVACNVKPTL